MNIRLISALMLFALLTACGGGGGGNANPPPLPAPSALSYPATVALTRGNAMTVLTPTVTGTVVSYSVTPALPVGVAINTVSGVIGGTPTAVTATANYQVTATNGSGSTNTTVALTVNDTAPDIGYPQAQLRWSTGAPVSLTPTSTGGAVSAWSINPALPAGVAINSSTGVISGTPSAATAVSSYVVTATNSGGTDTFNLNLDIQNGVLLELGHADGLIAIDYDGQRILSVDAAGRAILWGGQTTLLATRAGVRHTDTQRCWTSCYSLVSLHNDTAVMQTPTTLIVLDASDGSELSVIPFNVTTTPLAYNLRWWQLSTDGSYVVTASDTELKIWSRSGTVIATKAGDYLPARAYAAPGELRVGGGPAAANAVERIALPSGTSTLSAAHQGTFHSWFNDGSKFLTTVGNTVWVYSNAVAQLDFAGLDTIENLTGQGNWFWTRNSSSLRIFAVGNSSTPAVTYALGGTDEVVSRGTLLMLLTPNAASDVSIVNLAGAMPIRSNYSTILGDVSAIAAAAPNDWLVGTGAGALINSATGPTLMVYSYGQVRSIAADANTIAIATAAERVVLFNATTRAWLNEMPILAEKIELADSGEQLVAQTFRIPSRFVYVRAFSLQTGNVLQQWQYPPAGSVFPVDISVARSANVLAQSLYEGAATFGEPQPYERLVTTLANGFLWTKEIQGGSRIFLSPNGTITAIPVEPGQQSPFPSSVPTTNLYSNGVLTGALPGRLAGWLDDSRVVVNRMKGGLSQGDYVLDHVEVLSTTGTVLSTPTVAYLDTIQPVTANSFYETSTNKIYDATTGETLFSSTAPTRGRGAVAGSNVVFSSGATVRIEPR